MCRIYNRPVEIWAFDSKNGAHKLRTFKESNGPQGTSQTSPLIRLSYEGSMHYNSIVDANYKEHLTTQKPGEIEDNAISISRQRRLSEQQATEQNASSQMEFSMDDIKTCLLLSLQEPTTSGSDAKISRADSKEHFDSAKESESSESLLIEDQIRIDNLIARRIADIDESEIRNFRSVIAVPTHEVVIKKFSIDMTRAKLHCLKPRTWVNDELINFYMNMLMVRDEKLSTNNPERRTSHYFNSFFMGKLLTDGQYNYAAVKKWSKKFDVFEKDKVFIPVNISNSHWTLCVVYVQKKEIAYYNSMRGSGKKYLDALLHWLKDEATEKENPTLDTSAWVLTDRAVPQQQNSEDCGVFTITCADFISDDLPLHYDQSDVTANREKFGAAIIRGAINY